MVVLTCRDAVVPRHVRIGECHGPGRPDTFPSLDQEADQRGTDGRRTALQAARGADAGQLPHEQPEIEAAHVHEDTLQDVGMVPQMHAAQPPGLVEMRVRPFEALLRGSKTDPQRPLPTDPLTTDSVRRRPTKLSHLNQLFT